MLGELSHHEGIAPLSVGSLVKSAPFCVEDEERGDGESKARSGGVTPPRAQSGAKLTRSIIAHVARCVLRGWMVHRSDIANDSENQNHQKLSISFLILIQRSYSVGHSQRSLGIPMQRPRSLQRVSIGIHTRLRQSSRCLPLSAML